MKLGIRTKEISIEIICLLYVVLFVYSGLSKLLDFEIFQVQLGQSPLLSAFAEWISWGVPILEILIAFLLLSSRFRRIALYAAFALMLMFTTYIIIILNFSSFIPCSCGGILEKMSWRTHLIFNIVFVFLALIGIVLQYGMQTHQERPLCSKTLKILSFVSFSSIALVAVLFMLSEEMIHHRNSFIRRFPHHPITFAHSYDLQQPSYYIAGVANGKIYLANEVAPLAMTVIDSSFKKKESFRIQLPENSFAFHSVRVVVRPPYFYISDGTVPVIFRGNTSDWKAHIWMEGAAYFNAMVPVTKDRILIRALSSATKENILGSISDTGKIVTHLNSHLLVKQIDGVFDTDGMLLYNQDLHKMIYTYYYRNQFIVADSLLNLDYRGHTIDTTTRAKIKVRYIKSHQMSKFSAPPQLVNKNSSSYGKYLYVNAALIGKYEPEEMWKTASIIDVYDLVNQSYQYSFYVDDQKNKKMSDFKVWNNLLIGIRGNHLFSYRFKSEKNIDNTKQ
ncbi:DoxX family protein [Flavobacterium sp. MAHUQ-51]|uniref:DoxX family protein n=1 Tax=Flavobacterium sp. GCM10022190 TaxID=3252639 RepID=UPI00361E352E